MKKRYREQDLNPYAFERNPGKISKTTLEVARRIRGTGRRPAILIHGVLPRSGSVYTAQLLALHPDVHAHPNNIWELPFLRETAALITLQNRFFRNYNSNAGKIGNMDFLPLFGAALVSYLYSFVPKGKTMLLKEPDVRFLTYFPLVFPFENLLLLMRDGRDLVHSFVNTWPENAFADVCQRWNWSSRLVLDFYNAYSRTKRGYWMVKYEDIVHEPESLVREACERFELDPRRYPYKQIRHLKVSGSSSLREEGKVTWKAKRRPADFNPIGHWRDWPESDKLIFKDIAGRTLQEAGFSRSAEW